MGSVLTTTGSFRSVRMSDEWQMISKTRERILTELSILLGIPLSSIDLNASFIQVGGNSLSATALIAACKLHGVFLDLEWIYLSPTITDLLRLSVQTYSLEEPEPYVSLRTQYKALLSIPDGMTTTTETDAYPNAAQNNDIYQCHKSARLGPIDGIESYPMTEIQLSLIHGSQKTPGTNVIHYHETYQTCDIPAMKAAWEQVWRSEPIFQIEFVLHEGNGCLFEREVVPLPWTEVTVANQEQYDACKQKKCLETRISSSFTVITLLSDRQDDCKSTIIWCIHHALIDGYSSSLILEKVRSAAAGMPIYPGPSFARFSEELNAFHRRAKGAVQVFWKQKQEKFESAAGELLLPAPSPNSACKNNITETITMKLQLEEISAFVQKTGITTACLYYAAWALAFSMFVDSDSVVFGVVLSGRNLPIAGVESVVGPVINMLPFHISLESGSTALEYLRCTFSHLAELTSRQWSRPEDGFSRKFSSALAVQYKALEFEGTFLEKPFSRVTSDVPLYVLIEPDGDVSLNYHSDLYSKSHIELLGHIFFNAISALLRPHQSISRCFKDLLPCQVVSDLRRFGNCLSLPTTTPLSKGNLVTLFKQAAARFPNATAIEKGNASLSYLELNTLTTCAAHQISALVQPGEVVCVHADGSINWIVAIYSVLKAGGVYCPFDETLPVEARKANFKAAGSRLFLVPDTAGKVFQPGNCVSCVSIDELVGVDLAQFREDAFATLQLPMPSTNAYLCFTSGSTGVPKGVLCRHDSLVAFQSDLSVRLFAGPGRKISQIMSPAFDGSVHEIFSALSHGATLVLRDSINPFAHLQKADSAVLTPSIANVLDPMDYPKLTAVYLVGETVPQNVNDRWAAHKMLYNMYGPTEATCGATIKQLLPNQPVTIGIPNPSTRIYILNKRQKLVPLGVIGEICLAGIQVSEGYIGRPVETAERFVSDPICSEFGDRMYKTGDHGYWNQEGEIICLGRIDRQVKLRGFRIDLNHIECQMRRAASDVDTLAVAQKKDFLVAMIQPSSVDVPVFRAKIAKVLPVHALPRYVTAVDALPLTLTGKVDYEKVANSELPSGSPNVKLLASSSTQRIVGVWRDILNLAPYIPIDAESDFLDLGGNSIKQMLLSIRLSAYLGHQIPLRVVVESPTLSDLVKAIEGLDSIPDSTEKEQSLHEHELSSIEKDWWHKYEMGLGSSAFNVSFVCKLGSSIDLSKLTLSWNTILARHKILSGRYTLRRRLGVTKIFPPSPPQVARVNQIDIWQEVNRPFDLRKESPIGVTISASHMAVRISHIICDLTSLRQLLHEVTSVYHGSSLAPIEKTYPSRMVEGSIILPSNLEFWTECLSNLPSQQQYGTIKPQARTSYRGTSAICKLPPTLFHAMIDFAAKQKVTFHQMSLAAVAIALQHGPESLDIILGAPYLNRKCENDMQTIGLFLEPLPTRIRHSTATQSSSDRSSNADLRPESQSFVHAVQRSSQAALSHAMPWTQLLEHLKVTPDFPDHPLFDVMVTFHDERYETSLPISGCEPLYTWAQGAKFKLMTEFVAVSQDSLLLRVEYDTECFERRDVEVLQRLLAGALRSLVEQDNYNEMKERMKELEHGDNGEDELERMKESETFGFELKKL